MTDFPSAKTILIIPPWYFLGPPYGRFVADLVVALLSEKVPVVHYRRYIGFCFRSWVVFLHQVVGEMLMAEKSVAVVRDKMVGRSLLLRIWLNRLGRNLILKVGFGFCGLDIDMAMGMRRQERIYRCWRWVQYCGK